MPKVIFKIEAPVLAQQVGAQKTQPHRQATQEPCQELTATGLTFRPDPVLSRDSSQYSNGWTGATPMGWGQALVFSRKTTPDAGRHLKRGSKVSQYIVLTSW